MYKVFLQFPEALRPAFPRLKEKLEDPDTGAYAFIDFKGTPCVKYIILSYVDEMLLLPNNDHTGYYLSRLLSQCSYFVHV